MATLVPIGANVVIKRDEAETKTPGGLFLPETAQKTPARGKVLAVGDGGLIEGTATRRSLSVKEGDHIIYEKYSATEVIIDGQTLYIVPEKAIYATLVDSSK